MNRNYFAARDLLYLVPLALAFGASLASIQPGSWRVGFLAFSVLSLAGFSLLKFFTVWANDGRRLAWIVLLAFLLRLGAGVALHLALPVYGHGDEDDRAGYVFTDAHRRDDQAWKLAVSELPVIDAFLQQYGSDQYGGLLAFNTFIYRYFSPDAQRPLMLILLSAFFAALGVPFLWKAVRQVFGEPVAWASAWIFALYPDSILLGASAMREPYLLTFSALVLWGFVHRFYRFEESPSLQKLHNPLDLLKDRIGWMWIAIGLVGMLLVSPAIALVTIIIFVGWLFVTNESREISWRGIAAIAVLFVLGLFFLASSLNRSGAFSAGSPLHIISDWFQAAVKFDAYQAERDSGWVQKIFDESPEWLRLPFITIYGIFQPVLPATLIRPNKLIWKLIILPRALSWYALLPILAFSFVTLAVARRGSARQDQGTSRKLRNLVLWLTVFSWMWILLSALRGGADLWDNPRYRTILFMWQAIVAAYVWVWSRETQNAWFSRILLMEAVFLLFFTQWYASRYYHIGGQLPFGLMVDLILGLWGLILGIGWWRDKQRLLANTQDSPTDARSMPQSSSADKLGSPADKFGSPVDKNRA